MTRLKLQGVSDGYALKEELIDAFDLLDQPLDQPLEEGWTRLYDIDEVLRIAEQKDLTVFVYDHDKNFEAIRQASNRAIEHGGISGYWKLDFDLVPAHWSVIAHDRWEQWVQKMHFEYDMFLMRSDVTKSCLRNRQYWHALSVWLTFVKVDWSKP